MAGVRRFRAATLLTLAIALLICTRYARARIRGGHMPKLPSPSDRFPLSDTITEMPKATEPTPDAVAQEAALIYPDTNAGPPTPQQIAEEAYKIYQTRGEGHGRDVDDWLEAERRLRSREPSA
jgi:hypothetical protein